MNFGMKKASFTPKVSETMDEIIEMIQTLVEKEKAYIVDGEVFFMFPALKAMGSFLKRN